MKRFIIGAVAVVAAFASFSTPAHATHDRICAAPTGICVSGYEHQIGDTQDAAWAAYLEAVEPIVAAYETGRMTLEDIPEPLCVQNTHLCVEGLRGAVLFTYWLGGIGVFVPPLIAMCYATGRPECPLPAPPV